MAAILRLRRGTSTPTLLESELFFNTTSETLVVGESTGNHTLVKIGSNTGDVSFTGDVSASNLSLSGNANIVGNITLGGDIYLGDGDNTTDKINVNASLSGSLVPDTDGVYDLGSTSFRYNNIHVLSASIENLNVGGSGILSSSQQITDYNTFLEINGMNVVSGSSQIDLTQTTNYVSGIKTRLNSETVISGSSQVTISDTTGYNTFSSSIATTDEGQNVRLDNIETFTASLDATFEEIASSTHTLVSGSSQIDVNTTQNFQTFSSSVDTRLDEVESTSSINETDITELFYTSSNHESRVGDLEVTGSDHETRIDSLETFSSSLDDTFVTETELNLATSSLSASLTETDDDFESRITEIETTFSSSVDDRLDELETTFSSSVDSRLDIIEGEFSQSVDSRLDDTESTGSVHESRLDNIESYTASLDDTYEEKSSATHTLFSGSSQVNADTITNFDSNVKTKLDLDNVVSSSIQVTISDTTGYTDFSASIATTDEGQNDRLDSIEAYTASVDSLYEEISSGTHTLVSGSSQIEINDVTGFTTHSSSVDSRLDSLEGDSHAHSNKIQLDTINQTLSKTSNVTFNDITSSGNVIIGGDLTVLGNATEIQTSELRIEDKLITIASGSTNSAEADGSGIEIDGAGKSIIWDDATQSFILNAQVSSSVGFKGDGSELTGVTADSVAFADITGKPTLVSGSSQISFNGITDKPTLFSGSSQVNADTITNFDSNVKTKLDSDSVVSGSTGEQLTASLDSRYLEINGDGVFSGSSQVNADTITNFDSNVKDKMNLDNVISGSVQITNGSGILSSSNENFTQFSSSIDSRVDTLETTFSSSVDSRLDEIETTFSSSVDSRLDAQEAFSESLDNEFLNTNGDNVVSGSTGDQLTASLDLRYEEISSGTNTLVSGSSQVDVTQTTNIETIATTGSNVFIGNQTITGSLTTSGSVSFEQIPWPLSGNESHFFKTEPFTVQLESGSRSYDYAGFGLEHYDTLGDVFHNSFLMYMYDNHENPTYGTEINLAPVRSHFKIDASGSDEQAGITIMDNQDGTTLNRLYGTEINIGGGSTDSIIIGSGTTNNIINGLNTNVYSPITSSNTIEATFFHGDGSNLTNVVASEITYEDITNLPSGLVSGSSQIDVTQATNYSSIRQYDNSDNTTHLNSLGVVSGSTYSSPSQGTLRATINGANSDVDLGLQSTDTPTFNSLTASNLPEHDNTHYDAVFKGTSGEFGYRTLATAAFYHVSNSIDDGNPLVLGNAGAVKTYVDAKIIDASAGDITEVNAGPGLGGGSTIGAATLNLDTGSQHFIDGVVGITPTLPEGLVSGSDQVTQSLDTRYVNVSGDTVTGDLVISGDLTVNGTTTTISTTNLNVEDNIIELNYGGSATNGGILVKDVTGGSITSGSLLWDGSTDSWIAGTLGSENRILTTADNVITDTNIDTKIKLKLDSDNVHSGSYLGTATTSQLNEGTRLYYTDLRVKTKLDLDGVVSGSVLRNLDGTGILSSSNENFTDFSSSVDSRFGALSTDYNDLQNVPSGIVSSSEQVSNYNTFLEINGDSVISSSAQVQIDSVTGFTTFSSSVDNRLDLLELFSTSLDDNFVTELELNTATQSLQDSIDLKLDISTYTPFSTSVDSRLDGLEGVTSENPLTFNDTTTVDLIRTGDVITANVIGGVVSGSSQVIGILDSLNTYTSSNDINQNTQNGRLTSLEVETGSIASEQSIQDGRLDNLETYTASLDNVYEEKSSATHTLVSGSSQVIEILDSLNSYTSSNETRINSLELEDASIAIEQSAQDDRLDNLETYTSSLDNVYEEKSSATHTLVSGSSQIDVTQTTNYSSINQYSDAKVKLKLDADSVVSGSSQVLGGTGILSSSVENFETYSSSVDERFDSLEGTTHSHSNKTQLDTINQNLSTTSDVQFNNIQVDGTGSFAADVTIYGDLTVLGTETIINTENLAIADNMIYLNSGSTVTNPDLGWAGNYNDGTYAHLGLFADASDSNTFKIYKGYTPEPEGGINTAHESFQLADFQSHKNISVTSSTEIVELVSGSQVRGSIYGDENYTYVFAPTGNGIALLTNGTTDGIIINSNGDTTIYGGLALETIPSSPTSTSTLVVGAGNVVSQRALGSNAFNSNDYLLSDTDDTASGIITFSNTTQSTTNTTGAVIVSGGVGISKTLNVGEDVVAYASSDRRLKKNITPISKPLQKINSIGGYSFDWNVEKQHIYKGKDYGVIAQEIEEILPELVDTRENGYKAVKYDKLVSLLIEGIKELSQEVNELKTQINK